MKHTKDKLMLVAMIALPILLCGGGCYVKYQINKQRYPEASAWTHFFK